MKIIEIDDLLSEDPLDPEQISDEEVSEQIIIYKEYINTNIDKLLYTKLKKKYNSEETTKFFNNLLFKLYSFELDVPSGRLLSLNEVAPGENSRILISHLNETKTQQNINYYKEPINQFKELLL
mgnify:CR=1 FL=1